MPGFVESIKLYRCGSRRYSLLRNRTGPDLYNNVNYEVRVLDKRVLKTKRSLKEALFRLLQEKDFETIKTTEICERALVSRNTFYNYYADKYALLEDCFSDYEDTFLQKFDERQQKTNSGHDIKKSFLNLVDTFFELDGPYQSISILSSFDLQALYYRAFMNILEHYEDSYSHLLNPEYDFKQLNSFLVLGFWGFIHGNPSMDQKAVQEKTRMLVLDLINSPIFRVKK